ncbi:MAG: TPM domain-containing protein [Bacteroidota bacterium]
MQLLLSLLLFIQFPQQEGYVNDFAGLLTTEQRTTLENKLADIDEETAIQLSVVTMPNLGKDSPRHYATQLGNHWAIGQQKKYRGILILVAEAEKEVFIATGLGLTKTIPSSKTQEIVDQLVIPLLKDGAYYAGIDNAINAIVGKWSIYDPENTTVAMHWIWTLVMAVVFGLVVYSIIEMFRHPLHKKRRNRTGWQSGSSDSGLGGDAFDGDGGGGSYSDGDSGDD